MSNWGPEIWVPPFRYRSLVPSAADHHTLMFRLIPPKNGCGGAFIRMTLDCRGLLYTGLVRSRYTSRQRGYRLVELVGTVALHVPIIYRVYKVRNSGVFYVRLAPDDDEYVDVDFSRRHIIRELRIHLQVNSS